MKAKAKLALECEEKSTIYARSKVEVESVFGHIKGNRSFRIFLAESRQSACRVRDCGFGTQRTEVTGILRLLSENNRNNRKAETVKLLPPYFFTFSH